MNICQSSGMININLEKFGLTLATINDNLSLAVVFLIHNFKGLTIMNFKEQGDIFNKIICYENKSNIPRNAGFQSLTQFYPEISIHYFKSC